MFELSEQNAPEYLRARGKASSGEILVQSLSGGIANVVLKCFDTGAGEALGSSVSGPIPRQGECIVLKQPLPRFKTEAEWLVDIDRVLVERDCIELLGTLLPAGTVPEVRWYDPDNSILAISCAPPGAEIWKKALLAGRTDTDAATHAGMLLAMLHSSTAGDPAVEKRFGDPRLFLQQRIDPYLRAAALHHPELAPRLEEIAQSLLRRKQCLIHGDFSPKNIFLLPMPQTWKGTSQDSQDAPPAGVSGLLLLDFEVAFYGDPAFDVATLLNHLLLKAFYRGAQWRSFMLLADHFWETYRQTADPELVRGVSGTAGPLLGPLLLARVDGKSPAEYLVPHPALQQRVRSAARALLSEPDRSLARALARVATCLNQPC